MKRWIKVEIEVDDKDVMYCETSCTFCKGDVYNDYCSKYGDKLLLDLNRYPDCLAADVTDLVAENEELKKEVEKYKRAIDILIDHTSIGNYCSHLRGWTCKYKEGVDKNCIACALSDALKQAEQEASDDSSIRG